MMIPGKKTAMEWMAGFINRWEAANTALVMPIANSGEKRRRSSVCIHPLKKTSSIKAAAMPPPAKLSVLAREELRGRDSAGQFIAITVSGINTHNVVMMHSRIVRFVNFHVSP